MKPSTSDCLRLMLTSLARERQVFHSEADFQHSLAVKVKEAIKSSEFLRNGVFQFKSGTPIAARKLLSVMAYSDFTFNLAGQQ